MSLIVSFVAVVITSACSDSGKITGNDLGVDLDADSSIEDAGDSATDTEVSVSVDGGDTTDIDDADDTDDSSIPNDPCKELKCDDNASCSLDPEGQAGCHCNEGFEGDGLVCSPIVTNPCDAKSCDEFADCTVNTEDDAVCSCQPGFEGDGDFCKAIGEPCKDYVEPACLSKGCPQGHICDTQVECIPSMCVCNEKSGQPFCTDDCGGGVCVPNSKCAPISCLLQCDQGYVENKDGCPICECVVSEDVCADFDPNENCGGKSKSGSGAAAGECKEDCVCDPQSGKIKCPGDDCGIGSCNLGNYCEGGGCIDSKCYAANHPKSLLLCQGVLDACCGEGQCVNSAYCTGPNCDNPLCYEASHPISQLLCGEISSPGVGCGVGSCNKMGHYCDDCMCYLATHPLSQLFCECEKGPDSLNTFQKVYGNYTHSNIAMAGVELSDGGFFFAGWSGMATRTDKFGNPLWIKRYAGMFIYDVAAHNSMLYLIGGTGLLALNLDGEIQWSIKAGGSGVSVVNATDGGVVFGARKDQDMQLVKVDAGGAFLWGYTYGGVGIEKLTHVEALADGYLLVGTTESFGAQNGDYFIVRTDLNGSLQWAKRLGGAQNDGDWAFYSRAIQSSDGGFLLAGFTEGFGAGFFDGLAIKLSSSGMIEWSAAGGGPYDDWWNAVTEVDDGYVFFGTSQQIMVPGINNASPNVWLSKLNKQGALQWSHVYGDVAMDGNYVDGGSTSDGGLFVIAHSHNYFVDTQLHKRHYLLKTNADGLTPGCCNEVEFVPSMVSPELQHMDVTSQLLVESVAPLSPFNVTHEDYTEANVQTVCEQSVGVLCGGISTGTCSCNK